MIEKTRIREYRSLLIIAHFNEIPNNITHQENKIIEYLKTLNPFLLYNSRLRSNHKMIKSTTGYVFDLRYMEPLTLELLQNIKQYLTKQNLDPEIMITSHIEDT